MKKIEVTKVKVKVRAIEQGYYGGEIIPVGKEFTYEGGLNRAGGLPLWVEALEEVNLPEAKKEEVSEEAPALTGAPVLPTLASTDAQALTPAQKAAATRAAKKAAEAAQGSLADSIA